DERVPQHYKMRRLLPLLIATSCFGQFPYSGTTWPVVSPLVTDTEWSIRVVSNGGAKPSQSSITAEYNFLVRLTNDGIRSKIIYANIPASDSLAAALTPQLYNSSDNFASTANYSANNGGFVLADVSVNGITGNGTSKYFKTGTSVTNFTTTAGSIA